MRGADGKERIPSVREWRRRRDQAGILIHYVVQTPRGSSLRKKAWKVFEEWQEERITFEEARERLERLAAEAKR